MANRIIKQRFTSPFLLRCYESLSNHHSISCLSCIPRLRPIASPCRLALSGPVFPLDEKLVLEGCDFKHWLIVTDYPEAGMTHQEIIDGYVRTLTSVVGSEEEARKMIYSVSTKHYYAFGVLMPEELAMKMRDLENVRFVLPDSYLDAEKKDYGGEPFIHGEAVPYDPKYHEVWLRNNPQENSQGAAPDKMDGMAQKNVGGRTVAEPRNTLQDSRSGAE